MNEVKLQIGKKGLNEESLKAINKVTVKERIVIESGLCPESLIINKSIVMTDNIKKTSATTP